MRVEFWAWRNLVSSMRSLWCFCFIFIIALWLFNAVNAADATDCINDDMAAMGQPPVVALIGDRQLSAGFSEEGKLVTFFYPSVGAYDRVPYWTTRNCTVPYGTPPHLGAFLGTIDLSANPSNVHWLINPEKIDHDLSMPAFNFYYPSDVRVDNVKVDFKVFSPMIIGQSSNSIVYDVSVQNLKPEDTKVGIVYYAFFDPNPVNQQPFVFSCPEVLTRQLSGWNKPFQIPTVGSSYVKYTKENLLWVKKMPLEGKEYYIGITSDLPVVDAYAEMASPRDSSKLGAYKSGYSISSSPPDGDKIFLSITTPSSLPLPLNGYMIWKIDLKKFEQKHFKIIVSANDENERQALWWLERVKNEFSTRQLIDYTEESWSDFLKTLRDHPNFHQLSDSEKTQIKWWVMTMALMADKKTGAIVASPILTPQYYGSWPRDGTWQAITWTALGYKDIASKYYDWLTSLNDFKKNDAAGTGKWYQCYDSRNGDYVGLGLPPKEFMGGINTFPLYGIYEGKILEEDQMSLVLLGIWYYYKGNNDVLPDGVTKEEVRSIADYILKNIEKNEKSGTIVIPNVLETDYTIKAGLIRPSSDAYEFPGEVNKNGLPLPGCNLNAWKEAFTSKPEDLAVRQSSYVNFAGSSALKAAYDITEDTNYEEASWKLRDQTFAQFYNKDTRMFDQAWSIFAQRNYNRPMDYSTQFAWPIQAYPKNDIILQGHCDKTIDKFLTTDFRTKENPRPSFFVPGLLTADVYKNVIKGDITSERFLDKIEISDQNDYIPEKVRAWNESNQNPNFSKLLGAEPLGWSHAMGVMTLLTKAGYKPPTLYPTDELPPTVHNDTNPFQSFTDMVDNFLKQLFVSFEQWTSPVKKTVFGPTPEEIAVENAISEVMADMAAMANLIESLNDLMTGLYQAIGQVSPQESRATFTYQIIEAQYFRDEARARAFMSSHGSGTNDIEEAIGIVNNLGLAQNGYVIVMVEATFATSLKTETARGPILCNEQGKPYYKSWQFYQNLKEHYSNSQNYPNSPLVNTESRSTTAQVSGTYQGYYQYDGNAAKYPFTITLRQSGSTLSGTIRELRSTFGPNTQYLDSTLQGRVSGNSVYFVKTYAYDGHQVTYNGVYSSGTKQISGRWNIGASGGAFIINT